MIFGSISTAYFIINSSPGAITAGTVTGAPSSLLVGVIDVKKPFSFRVYLSPKIPGVPSASFIVCPEGLYFQYTVFVPLTFHLSVFVSVFVVATTELPATVPSQVEEIPFANPLLITSELLKASVILIPVRYLVFSPAVIVNV